jgi:pimeloyl-ACP methyl ester carboxylesterase
VFPTSPPELPGVEHRDVTVRRVRWHVAVAGDPGAPAVVLLHGWPQHFYAWRHVIDRLKGDFRVYAPDLRGFGWSDAPDGRYSKNGLACDVEDLLDVLEIDTCTLAGHDWGGFVAWLTALRAPQRVSRLATFNIIHPWARLPPPTPLTLLKSSYQWVLATPYLGEAVQRVGGQLVGTALSRGAGAGFEWDDEAVELYAGAFSRAPHARAASALYRTFLIRELPGLAAGRYENRRLDVPGVAATGDGDPLISEERLAGAGDHAPNVTTHVIAGAGHWTPEERPDEVSELIRGS